MRKLKSYAREQGWVAKRVTSAEVEEVTDFDMPESIELPYGGRNLRYLEERGINKELARFFHLRFCQKGQYIYIDGEGKRTWQNYDNRVLIPIYDLDGVLVTFQGRHISSDAPRKYLFPPGLPGSGRFLFNGHNVIGCEEIVIGEGAFDVMATKIAMDRRVDLRSVGQIGTFGKHLSHGDHNGSDQLGALIRLKEHGLKSVVFMWDGEVEAIKAAIECAKLVRSVGITARVALLPEGKDPNEVPPEVVIQAYEKAMLSSDVRLIRALIERARLKESNP
ncbi:toprim domain-containing protein [Aeromonas salmonicida]|uniref:toprim domain-containing protein n=1 Tax=Aeromonas salmonicida TaxID=645 RepID=UPI001F42338B|nr:toprim domain-containing protein [Aeromonas salmonicida]MCE9932730.1 toprim domain-containing protein [Aeromonas salmonicida]